MISSPKVSPPVPMILTQALEPYEQAASPEIRQNGDIAMPACPGTSPEPLPASSALRLAAHREPFCRSRCRPLVAVLSGGTASAREPGARCGD